MPKTHPYRHLSVLTLILLVGAALRIVLLSDVPPGLQHDEVFHAHDAFTVLGGYTPLWFSSNAGNEPLFIYVMALSTGTIGGNVLGIRLPAMWAGMLTLALTYQWGRRAVGRQAALIGVALMAVSFWPVWMSRVGLRAVILPPMVALVSWLHMRALFGKGLSARQRYGRYTAAGLALGLTLYTYPAAFTAPIVMFAITLYVLVTGRRLLREHGVMWLAALLSYAPLGIALGRAEEGYLRVQQTAVPLQALQVGDANPLVQGVLRSLLMWTHQGDPLWRYNVADRPVFGAVLAGLFVFGALISVWLTVGAGSRRSPVAVRAGWLMIPLWLVIGILPSAVTDSPPAFLRASAALPATFMAVGVGVVSAGRLLSGILRLSPGSRALSWIPLLMVMIVGIEGWQTVQDYFGTWAHNAEVARVYRNDLAAVAAYLEDNPPPGGVAISTSEPHHLDRFIYDYTPHGGVDVHWFDGLYTLVAPAGDDPAWLFVTGEPVPGERLQSEFLDRFGVVGIEYFAPDALAYELYELPSGEHFYEELPPPTAQGVWTSDVLAFPVDDPDGVREELAYPVQLGEVVRLVGYESAGEGRPGEWLPVTLYFQATADVVTPEPWSIFMHLLNEQGEFVTGRDFLAVPASTWREGDAFIQLHDLPLPEDIAPGDYHLQIGLYTQADGSRFPVEVDGQAVGDRILLEPVTITNP